VSVVSDAGGPLSALVSSPPQAASPSAARATTAIRATAAAVRRKRMDFLILAFLESMDVPGAAPLTRRTVTLPGDC